MFDFGSFLLLVLRRIEMPEVRGADPSSDFHFVERDDPEKIAATLVKLVHFGRHTLLD